MMFRACKTGTPICDSVAPAAGCNGKKPIHCPSGYRVEYELGCPSGCVRQEACPTIPPTTCGSLGEQACLANTACHAVYDDLGTCDCTGPGCCNGFIFCGEGAALCGDGEVACDRSPPDCRPAEVIARKNGCYEGCVNPNSCLQRD